MLADSDVFGSVPSVITAGARWTLAAALGAVTLSGCSSLGPDRTEAGEAAVAFHAAQRDADGERACALLTETTRTAVAESADEPCASAILDEDLPAADQVLDVAAYGRNARVTLDGDVVFLSVAGGTWKVTAAGCQPRPDAPYDCSLTGG